MKIEDIKTGQDLYQFLETIPEEKWIAGSYTGYYDYTKHCVLGHLGSRSDIVNIYGVFGCHAILLLNKYLGTGNTVAINDNALYHNRPEDTPKKRILNALKQGLES